jgi:hypothetical protein
MSLLAMMLIAAAIAIAIAGFYWFRVQRPRERAKAQAAWLNRELERTDSRLQVVEIWSDEPLERQDRQLADAILEKVGTDLIADESTEATRLRAFLCKIQPTDAQSGLNSPRDIALAWFACMQIQDKDPACDLAKLFTILNDAWTASRDGQAHIGAPDQQTILRSIAATLVQSRTQS